MKAETDLTKRGHRLVATAENGTITLSCFSQVLDSDKSGALVRRPWLLAQLGIVRCSPIAEARKLVEHWLSYFGDLELTEAGLLALQRAFDSHPEANATQEAKASTGGAIH